MAAKAKMQREVVVVARTPGTNWARVLQGKLVSERECADGTSRVVLQGARQADYYGRGSGGEIGLAVIGPKGDSRIGPTNVGFTTVAGASLISDASPAAVEAWRSAPVWSGNK